MMTFAQLLILQIIAHLLADFIFQSDLWTRHKRRYGFYSGIIYWHVIIVFIISYLLSFQWEFVIPSLIISIAHLLIDGFKVKIGSIKIGRIKPFQKLTFFIDQFMHLLIIWIAVELYTKYYYIDPIVTIPISKYHLIIILGYLVCLKPSNIFIKEVFSIYNIKIQKQAPEEFTNAHTTNIPEDLTNALTTHIPEDLENAGKLIGNIERVLTLTLLLIGQFEAIGFIIASKSILRYEGKKTSKTEYVLIGTLLSFGIAIIIGIGIPFLENLIN